VDFLTEILASKRERVARARALCAVEDLRAAALELRIGARAHALLGALKDGSRLNVIAEVKRASPSRGVINADMNPAEVARAYEAGGACAVSVLTEEDRFRGSLDDLRKVREATRLPVLRKDFIFDEYQLYEAAQAGADALLLIVAALDDARLAQLRRITEDELGMDALVEVHTREELLRAGNSGATLIGVNNRNLHTFEVSIEVSHELSGFAPTGATLVSESGLKTKDDLLALSALGYRGFLIGETLMRAREPQQALRELLEERQKERES
jgi:indole-3-glycerol phosphate synthase